MKIQCDSCGRAEAEVLCSADEAVLCVVCDEAVHAANKLSSKHHRVMLVKHPALASGGERKGYIFCLEGSLLCRNCDLGTHNVKPYTSPHRRFLITGVQVALQSPSSSNTAPSGQGYVPEEIMQVNRDMNLNMAVAASSTDTTAEFSCLHSHTATGDLMEQWISSTAMFSTTRMIFQTWDQFEKMHNVCSSNNHTTVKTRY